MGLQYFIKTHILTKLSFKDPHSESRYVEKLDVRTLACESEVTEVIRYLYVLGGDCLQNTSFLCFFLRMKVKEKVFSILGHKASISRYKKFEENTLYPI